MTCSLFAPCHLLIASVERSMEEEEKQEVVHLFESFLCADRKSCHPRVKTTEVFNGAKMCLPLTAFLSLEGKHVWRVDATQTPFRPKRSTTGLELPHPSPTLFAICDLTHTYILLHTYSLSSIIPGHKILQQGRRVGVSHVSSPVDGTPALFFLPINW